MSLSPDQFEHFKLLTEATKEMFDILENETYYKFLYTDKSIDDLLYAEAVKVYPDFLIHKLGVDSVEVFRQSCIHLAKKMYENEKGSKK